MCCICWWQGPVYDKGNYVRLGQDRGCSEPRGVGVLGDKRWAGRCAFGQHRPWWAPAPYMSFGSLRFSTEIHRTQSCVLEYSLPESPHLYITQVCPQLGPLPACSLSTTFRTLLHATIFERPLLTLLPKIAPPSSLSIILLLFLNTHQSTSYKSALYLLVYLFFIL